MQVKALRLGYYGGRRIKEDAIFDLEGISDFSHRWMEAVDFEPPDRKGPVIPFLGQYIPTVKENHNVPQPLSKVAKPTGEQSVI